MAHVVGNDENNVRPLGRGLGLREGCSVRTDCESCAARGGIPQDRPSCVSGRHRLLHFARHVPYSGRQVNARRTRRANQFRFERGLAAAAPNLFKSGVREKSIFACQFKLICPVQSLKEKYLDFVFQKYMICCHRSAADEGAYASSRTWCGMRWTG
jgi:hypothetical protein